MTHTLFLVRMISDHKLTHFLSSAADSNPILASCFCHSFQEILIVLSEAQIVVRANVDDMVYSPPS